MFGKLFGKKPGKLTQPTFQDGDVDGFWNWWFENGQITRELSTMPAPAEALMNGISEALQRIHPDLVFEVGVDKQGRLDLVLSADGIRSVFPDVLALAKAFPQRAGFTVTSFRQRQDVQIGIAGRRLSAVAARFISAYDNDEEHIDVRVFLPLSENAVDRSLAQFGFLLLDCVLGEYDVATSLGAIEFAPMSQAPEEALPLPELAALVDAMNAERTKQ